MLIDATDDLFERLVSGAPLDGLTVAEGGLEAPEVLAMLQGLAAGLRESIDPCAWLMVEAGEVVGLISLTKPPTPEGAVEIGYGVAESRRGRGVAGRAVGDLLVLARAHPDLKAIIAETSPRNLASQAALVRNGFVRTGERFDAEDGDLICWRVEV